MKQRLLGVGVIVVAIAAIAAHAWWTGSQTVELSEGFTHSAPQQPLLLIAAGALIVGVYLLARPRFR